MPDVGDVKPLLPIWPKRPADGDGQRKRPPPAPDKPPGVAPNKDDDDTGHVDEYATGE